jgi:hypothetical protein
VAQINENTYRINDLEAIIAGYQQADLPTGAVASITDGTALLMPSLKVGIEPVQSGSGDPSPDNIRPISGWTAANVVVSPTTSAEDGTTYTIEFRDGDNPLTVYGGTLDVTSGELVVDRAMLTIDNNSSIAVGGYGMNFKINTPTDAKVFPSSSLWQSKCNMMTEVIQASSWGIPATYSFAGNSSQIYFKLTDDLIDVDELKAFLTENPIKICYILNEPITYHLTPTQIRTLVGNNNIWADTGDIIEGKYFKSLT